VAAKIRRELNTEVDMVHAEYGEYKVLVDGDLVIEGGPLRTMGVVPSGKKIVEAVRERLEREQPS